MASNFKLSIAARNAACNGIVDLVDGGAVAGTLTIFTGAPPTNPSDADPATVLGILTFSDPAFGNAGASVDGRADASSITSDTTANNNGDAGCFRVKDSNGVVIMQGTAGEAADTPDMTFDEKTIVAGGTIACTQFRVTVPEQ